MVNYLSTVCSVNFIVSELLRDRVSQYPSQSLMQVDQIFTVASLYPPALPLDLRIIDVHLQQYAHPLDQVQEHASVQLGLQH